METRKGSPVRRNMTTLNPDQKQDLAKLIKQWASELGFQQCGIVQPDLSNEKERLQEWLDRGYQGEMSYLENHFEKRLQPEQLVPGTCSIIAVRMDYLPPDVKTLTPLRNPDQAYIARYTLGRDYHKLVRKRLTQLGKKIEAHCGELGYRAFVDSAPILERPIARQAGIGWQGKHTLVINRTAGSWFFLAELFVDIDLPTDKPYDLEHCGRCTACLDICPTQAFPEPNVLDARRCISYLTIELKGSIPEELRPLMGNRIFGCDDCQLICPWNRLSNRSEEDDFKPRHNLDDIALLDLYRWDEATFLKKTEGSAIRRTGHEGWLRNISVALGNSRGGKEIEAALIEKTQHPSSVVAEHASWALKRLKEQQQPEPIKLLQHPRARKIKE